MMFRKDKEKRMLICSFESPPCRFALRCLCVWRLKRGRWTGQIPTHNLNLIGPGLTGWGQNQEKISHINQDKIIS